MGFLGSAMNYLKKPSDPNAQAYNNPAPAALLPAPQMDQMGMAEGGVVPAGQAVVVGDQPKSAYDHAKDDAMHAYSVGKAYLSNLANQGKAYVAPYNSEVQALDEKNAGVNAVKTAMAPPAAPVSAASAKTAPVDVVGQAPAKGERPIDTSHMTKPLQDGGTAPADEPALVGEVRPETLITESGKQQVVGQAGPEVITPKENAVVIPNAATAGPEKGPEVASVIAPEKPSAMVAPAPPTHGMASTGMAGAPKIPAPITSGATDHPQGPSTAMTYGGGATPASTAVDIVPPVDPLAKERALVENDKKEAMVKGDMTGLGKALIHERVLNNTTANKAVMEAAAAGSVGATPTPAPPSALSVSPTGTTMPASATIAESTPTIAPKSAFKARELQYDTAAQAGRDLGTPAGDVQAAEQERAKAGYEKLHPWGSALNHPGILGKIEHGLAKAGNIAGNIAAPGTMALIPGTELNKERQLAGENKEVAAGRQQEAEAIKAAAARGPAWNPTEELSKADTALRAAKAAGDPKAIATAQGVVDDLTNAIAKNQPPKDVALEQQLLDSKNKEAQLRAGGDVAGADAELANGQRITEAINAKAKAAGGTDDRARFVQKYLVDNKLPDTAENELAADQAYTDATQKAPIVGVAPGPGGAQTAFQARPGQALPKGAQPFAQQAKDDDKYYTYQDDKGKTQYAQGKDIPEGVARNEQDNKTFPNEFARTAAVQDSINTLWKDVYSHPEIFDKAGPHAILSAATADMDTQFGALVGGTGGSLHVPKTLTEDLQVALQNHTMSKADADAVKDYVTDYRAAKDKALAIQMDLQGGKIGRGNAQAFNAIVQQMPYGATPDSRQAKRALTRLQTTLNDLGGKYPDKLGGQYRGKPFVPPAEKLQVGDIVKGHVYQGGPAHDPASWKKE